MRLRNNADWPYPWMLRPERDSDVLEECLCLFFVLGSRRYRHRKTENVARLLVGGLGKYRVFAESYRDIAHLIDSACIDASEVFNAREHDIDELAEEILRARAAECDLIADDIAGARFEIRNRFLGPSLRRRLAGDAAEAVDDELEALLVFIHSPHTGRDHDLFDSRHLHDVGKP